MAKVNISDVEVLDNPATFYDKFKFKITFECFEPLEDGNTTLYYNQLNL